jgi:hypothetical protein
VSGRKPSPQLNAELESLDALLAGRNEVIGVLKSGALGDTKGVSEYFRAFARQAVDGLWLTGFTVIGAGNDISIEGRPCALSLCRSISSAWAGKTLCAATGFGTLSVQTPTETTANGEIHKTAEYLEFHMASRVPDASPTRGQSR